MESKIEQANLYDFYGELLTEHQRRIFEDFVFNDLSLGEIAQDQGISRQGVHDLVKRCGKALEDYEAKLHLYEKFQDVRDKVGQIQKLADQFELGGDRELLMQIRQLSGEILEDI